MKNEGNGLKGMPIERETRMNFDEREVRRGILQPYGQESMLLFPFFS